MKTVFTGFSPNNTVRDTFRALSFLVQPGKYFSGSDTQSIEEKLQKYFGVPFAITCDSGRCAGYNKEGRGIGTGVYVYGGDQCHFENRGNTGLCRYRRKFLY